MTFLTPAELARRWRKAGKIKPHRMGRGVRFSLDEIERVERESQVK